MIHLKNAKSKTKRTVFNCRSVLKWKNVTIYITQNNPVFTIFLSFLGFFFAVFRFYGIS